MNKYNKIGEVLKDPNNRCRGVSARNKHGHRTTINHKNACSWCLVGASYKVIESLNDNEKNFIIHEILGYRGMGSMALVWDEASDEEQDQIVNRLLSYDGVLDYRLDDDLV